MNEAEIREVVAHAVRETMLTLGVDVSTPADVREYQADSLWTRKSRLGAEQVAKLTKRSVIGIAVAGLAYAAFEGIRTLVSK